MLEQPVPPESYYFKELHFDGICLMVEDLFADINEGTWGWKLFRNHIYFLK